MKKIVFIVLILFFYYWDVKSQDLQKISDDLYAKASFDELVHKYNINGISVDDEYADSLTNIRLNNDIFCINNYCWEVNSPIYFLKIANEINFSFRLSNGYICILYLVDSSIETIEIFKIEEKYYNKFSNIKSQ